jgi:hypothetical protein
VGVKQAVALCSRRSGRVGATASNLRRRSHLLGRTFPDVDYPRARVLRALLACTLLLAGRLVEDL